MTDHDKLQYLKSIYDCKEMVDDVLKQAYSSTSSLQTLIQGKPDQEAAKRNLFAGLFQHVSNLLIDEASAEANKITGYDVTDLSIKFDISVDYEVINGDDHKLSLSAEQLMDFGRFFYAVEDLLKYKHNIAVNFNESTSLGPYAGFYLLRFPNRGVKPMCHGNTRKFVVLKALSPDSLKDRLIDGTVLNKGLFLSELVKQYNEIDGLIDSSREMTLEEMRACIEGNGLAVLTEKEIKKMQLRLKVLSEELKDYARLEAIAIKKVGDDE